MHIYIYIYMPTPHHTTPHHTTPHTHTHTHFPINSTNNLYLITKYYIDIIELFQLQITTIIPSY